MERAIRFLKTVLDMMGMEAEIVYREEEGRLIIHVPEGESALLIGR